MDSDSSDEESDVESVTLESDLDANIAKLVLEFPVQAGGFDWDVVRQCLDEASGEVAKTLT
eukprot:5924817-Prorocentrum_lima.AAC.1